MTYKITELLIYILLERRTFRLLLRRPHLSMVIGLGNYLIKYLPRDIIKTVQEYLVCPDCKTVCRTYINGVCARGYALVSQKINEEGNPFIPFLYILNNPTNKLIKIMLLVGEYPYEEVVTNLGYIMWSELKGVELVGKMWTAHHNASAAFCNRHPDEIKDDDILDENNENRELDVDTFIHLLVKFNARASGREFIDMDYDDFKWFEKTIKDCLL